MLLDKFLVRFGFRVDPNGVKQVTQGIGKIDKRLVILGAAAAAAGVALFKFAQKATKAFAEVEKNLVKIDALVGVNKKTLDGWNRDIHRIATESGQKLNEVTDALFNITSAGFTGKKAMNALESAAKGATTELGTTKQLASGMTQAMTVFGREVSNSTVFVDALTAAIRLGSAETDELIGGLSGWMATASAAGVTFAEGLGIQAALSRGGISSAESGVGITAFLAGLSKPTEDGIKALKELGLTFEELSYKVNDPNVGIVGVIGELRERMRGVGKDAVQVNLAIDDIFSNIRAGKFVKAINADFDNVKRISEGVKDSTDEAREAFEKMRQTISATLDRIGAKFDSLLIRVGAALAPMAKSVLDVVEDVADGFIDFFDGFEKVWEHAGRAFGEFFDTVKADSEDALMNGVAKDLNAVAEAAELAAEKLENYKKAEGIFTAKMLGESSTYIQLIEMIKIRMQQLMWLGTPLQPEEIQAQLDAINPLGLGTRELSQYNLRQKAREDADAAYIDRWHGITSIPPADSGLGGGGGTPRKLTALEKIIAGVSEEFDEANKLLAELGDNVAGFSAEELQVWLKLTGVVREYNEEQRKALRLKGAMMEVGADLKKVDPAGLANILTGKPIDKPEEIGLRFRSDGSRERSIIEEGFIQNSIGIGHLIVESIGQGMHQAVGKLKGPLGTIIKFIVDAFMQSELYKVGMSIASGFINDIAKSIGLGDIIGGGGGTFGLSALTSSGGTGAAAAIGPAPYAASAGGGGGGAAALLAAPAAPAVAFAAATLGIGAYFGSNLAKAAKARRIAERNRLLTQKANVNFDRRNASEYEQNLYNVLGRTPASRAMSAMMDRRSFQYNNLSSVPDPRSYRGGGSSSVQNVGDIQITVNTRSNSSARDIARAVREEVSQTFRTVSEDTQTGYAN